jgi:subtilisin family serine protease
VRRLVIAAILAAGALAAPAQAGAHPGRIAVGLAPEASPAELGPRVEAVTGGTLLRGIGPLRALVVSVRDVETAVEEASRLPGVAYAEPAGTRRSLSFTPTDPLASKQWYEPDIKAFDLWPEKPALAPVLVAVVDSGVDGSHPEFEGRIREAKSFVADPALVDSIGHGTMVAGEIAAAMDNGQGIAGVAFPAELLVAKVVGENGSISLEAEARAIRWAADLGARVINLSLGGPRDPLNPERDTFSDLEQSAVDYATRKGALVVAATGNCQDVCPYRFASYPAALPHVLGVSALNQNGSTPSFSNRDLLYNDIAAPGRGIVSTFPLELSDPSCDEVGYSTCASVEDYRRGEGTSFAAPLVSAAAALLFAQRPGLAASQAAEILERTVVDVQDPGHDRQTGWGKLDVQAASAALAGDLPLADAFEPNDDSGSRSYPLYGQRRGVVATLDYYQDQTDVYRIRLRKGQRVVVTLSGPEGNDANLVLWKPGTDSVVAFPPRGLVAALSNRPGPEERIRYRSDRTGWYFLQVKLSEGDGGGYRLVVAKRS